MHGLLGELRKQLVWEKGAPVPGLDPALWRRDASRTLIRYSDYGDRRSPFGWEADRVELATSGETENVANLRPLHWRTNAGPSGLLPIAVGF